MQLTIGQLLALVRIGLESAGSNLAINASKRRLAQLEMQVGGLSGISVEIPGSDGLVEPSPSSGKPSPKPRKKRVEKRSVKAVRAESTRRQSAAKDTEV
jgi:hypothetical protein